jgi:hypothetical protein
MDFEMGGILMSELNYSRGSIHTDNESEDDPQATTHEIIEFKKQYEALSHEEKARLPNWLREYIERDVGSN